MRSRWVLQTVLVIALVAQLSLPSGVAGRQEAAPETSRDGHALDVESFEYVWRTVHEKHFDPGFGGADWTAARGEFAERVAAAGSRPEVRRLIMTMLRRLKVTHFAIIPAELYETVAGPGQRGAVRGSPGFEARVVGSTTLVTSVERGSPAWEGGLRPGWEVLRIGEKDLAPLLASIAAEYDASLRDSVQSAVAVSLLHGRPDETLRALFGDGDGNTVERTIALREPPGHLFQAGNIPPIRVRFSASRLAGDVGYIAFNHFLDPATIMPAFNEAMLTFIDAQGIVLDLRGNPGGQAEMVTGMAGWFIPEKGKHLGFIRFRDLQLKLVVRPRPQVYAGPVAVVVDELSTCASEIMALGLRESGRARIFGTRTGGATLGSTIERLPNGDGFQYPFADFHSAAGQRLEGIGVVPDEEVRLTRESLLEGGDVQLEAAIHWIRARTRSAPATDNKIIK